MQLVAEYLMELKRRGISVVLVEQARHRAASDRVYVMGDRRIVFEGTPAEFKADANIRKEWLEV